jgi:voltage-gated potassium channel
MFAGLVSSTLVGRLMPLRAEQVRMSSITDHIVIAGWNLEVPMMLEELEREYGNAMPAVIVIANSERPSSLKSNFIFVQGEPTKESELEKARVPFARTVVVVSDVDAANLPATRDAVTLLTVFTIRSFEKKQKEKRRKSIHIVVEILDSENYEHAQIAGADEVIETSRLGSSLLAHTAGNPGIGVVVSELLLATSSNLYTDNIPHEIIGEKMTFGELREKLREKFDVLVIGFVHEEELNLNPKDAACIKKNDKLVYIGSQHVTA